MHEIDHLFTRFYKVSTHNNQIKGPGIGLHFTSQIVNAHGGRIEVERRLDEGSTFTVYLPRN